MQTDGFTTAFMASPMPQLLLRARSRELVAINHAFARSLGYSNDELVGRSIDELDIYATPADRDAMLGALRDSDATNRELHLRTKCGQPRTVVWLVVTIEIDGERTMLVVSHDISAQKETENALRASEARFANAFRKSPLPSAIVRLSDFMFLDVNEAFLALFGYSRSELVGTPAVAHGFWVDRNERELVYARYLADGKLTEQQVRMLTKTGERRDILWSMEGIKLAGDKCVMCQLQDVTQRNRDEDALRQSEARFATAFSSSPLASAIVRTNDHVFIAVNDAFVRLFGYSADELLGRTSDQFRFYADPSNMGTALRRADGRVRDLEVRLIAKDGSQLDVLISSERIDVGGTASVLGVFQDITARKQAESAMRESEARFRQLAENIREVFWLAEANPDRIVYVSPTYETIWGRPIAVLYEQPSAWTDAIHPEDRERVIASARHQRVIGTYAEQYRIVRPDGSMRWIHDRGFPVYDEHGVMIRFAGFAEDITDRLQLEDELRQTQKMESLGMLAGGVAHDFNNVLAVIGSCNGLLGEDMPAADPNRELIDEIDGAVTRAVGLTRQLLAFSRKQVTEPKIVELNLIVNETRKMLRRMVGEDIMLTVSLDPDLRRVKADPGYLVQVLMNLAVNARDAMPRGGSLLLATRNADISQEDARHYRGGKDGPVVMLEVTDTGVGMHADVLLRIFEPFFTTKAAGKGTGMGLAVVHGIIDQAGGFVDVTSTPGVGTTFKVYFPAVDALAVSEQEVVMALTRGSERILLVDDDDYVRRAAARALRARGYDVVDACGGQAALERLDRDSHFDLLLTDVVMPHIDGRQLGDAARERHRSIKVLYMSGYTDDAVVRHGVADGKVELIEKPFRIDALARKVRQVLDVESDADGHPAACLAAGSRAH